MFGSMLRGRRARPVGGPDLGDEVDAGLYQSVLLADSEAIAAERLKAMRIAVAGS
jgi:hypothetical protein